MTQRIASRMYNLHALAHHKHPRKPVILEGTLHSRRGFNDDVGTEAARIQVRDDDISPWSCGVMGNIIQKLLPMSHHLLLKSLYRLADEMPTATRGAGDLDVPPLQSLSISMRTHAKTWCFS